MTPEQIYEQVQAQLKEEQITVSPAEMKERASEYEGVPLDFCGTLLKGHPGIIAPIPDKKGSGPRESGDDAAALAERYVAAGANCLAVESRWRFFNEKQIFMQPVRERSNVPLLCCGYTIETYQIYEALLVGADAVLLEGRLLTDEAQFLLVAEAHRCGLQTVTLVDTSDLAHDAVRAGTDAVAANEVSGNAFNLNQTGPIVSAVAGRVPTIAFGGIATEAQLKQVAGDGAGGALVEPAFMEALMTH